MEFCDEAGNAPPLGSLILARLMKLPPPEIGETRTDLTLWRMLLQGKTGQMLDAAGPAGSPLVRERQSLSPEVWTEAELAALHALSHAGQDCRFRVDAAAEWLLEHLKAVNTNNHPWAVHVFLMRAHETNTPEYRLYAETLLHNCVAILGRPCRFASLILLDAGRAMIRAG